MTESHRRSSFYNVKILIYILKILGFLPLQISKSGDVNFKFLSFTVVYCIIIYGAQLYLLVNELGRLLCIFAFKEQEGYDSLLSVVLKAIIMSCHVQFTLAYWLQSRKMPSFIKKWQDFQEHYKNVVGETLSSKINYITTALIIVTLFTGALVIIAWKVLIDDTEAALLYVIMYYLVLLNIVFTTGFWSLNCYCIIIAARNYNSSLNQLFQRTPTETDLFSYRILWLNLCEVTRRIENVFAPTLIMMCMTQTVLFILCCYAGLASALQNDFNSFIIFLILLSAIFSVILITYATAHKATKQVGTETRNVILSFDLNKLNYLARYEVETFFASIATVRPTISIAGFTQVDRSTMFTIFINTVTYLIVLVQFRSSSAV